MKERLKYLRRIFNITQSKLASSINVSTSAVSNWESDVQVVPDRRLRDISRVYGVDYEWLRTGKGTPFPESKKTDHSDQSPYDFATSRGCDPILAKLFEAICMMNEDDQKEFARLIKQVLDIVNGEQIRMQSQRIRDFAQKIISTVNYTESGTINVENQENHAPLSSE